MKTNFTMLHDKVLAYEAPSFRMVELSHEGVLCESVRQIDNFELLEETDW